MKILVVAIVAAVVLAGSEECHAHGDLMRLGSTQDRRGQVAVEPDFDFSLQVFVTPTISLGGETFYSGIIPSFAWVIDPFPAGDPVVYPFKANTQVSMKIVQISPGAAVKVGGVLLNAVDKSAVIGTVSTDPTAHVHPEWQLTLPDGIEGEYTVRFKLTTTTSPYTESGVYTLTVTNRVPPSTVTPTPSSSATPSATASGSPTSTPTHSQISDMTPTSTATATANLSTTATATPTSTSSATATSTRTPRAAAADANCDGRVTAADVAATEVAQLDPSAPVCDADVNGDGVVDQQDTVVVMARIFGSAR